MIMFWNRKEIYLGTSMQEFSIIRDKLNANRIKYDYRLINHNASRRGRTGSFGENHACSTLYYLYVHKQQYEEACRWLQDK